VRALQTRFAGSDLCRPAESLQPADSENHPIITDYFPSFSKKKRFGI
jgi:hypothetical protein